jgi:hypothetical protein
LDNSPKPNNAPYDLVIGGCFYKHKESGVEIRLSGYSGRNGPDPELVVVTGHDQHGNTYTMTEAELYRNCAESPFLQVGDAERSARFG